VPERPEVHQVTVADWLDERRGDGPENLLPVPNHFEPGQAQEVGEIIGGEPVLVERRLRPAQTLGESESWLPQTAVGVQDDARLGHAQRAYLGQRALHVPQIVHQVRKDDGVKRSAYQFRRRVYVPQDEAQFRMPAARGRDHGRRKVDAHALGRLQCREQVAASAAKFQHAQPGRHQEAIDGLEPSMIACSRTPRACRPAGDSLPVGNACAAVGRRRGIPGLSRRRGHGPFLWGPQRSHHVRVRIWILSGHAWSPASALVLCPWTVLQPPAL